MSNTNKNKRSHATQYSLKFNLSSVYNLIIQCQLCMWFYVKKLLWKKLIKAEMTIKKLHQLCVCTCTCTFSLNCLFLRNWSTTWLACLSHSAWEYKFYKVWLFKVKASNLREIHQSVKLKSGYKENNSIFQLARIS